MVLGIWGKKVVTEKQHKLWFKTKEQDLNKTIKHIIIRHKLTLDKFV